MSYSKYFVAFVFMQTIFGSILKYRQNFSVLAAEWRSRLDRSSRKGKIGCSNLSRDRSKSLTQVLTDPLPNARWYEIVIICLA